MRTFVRLLSKAVSTAPAVVIVVTLAVTLVMGAFAGQAELATGNEGFAPENEELLAQERISDEFSGGSGTVVQVLVSGDDVISAAGLQAVQSIADAISTSEAARFLAQTPGQPPITSFLAPAQQAIAQQGIDPSSLDDAAVDELYGTGLQALPAESSGFLTRLVGESGSPEQARAPVGLVLVSLDTSSLDTGDDVEAFDALIDLQQDVVAIVEDAPVPAGITAEAFAFELVFGEQDAFNDEVGRLFGMAFVIILVILAFVYFTRPQSGGARGVLRGIRRTATDVALTLLAIVASIMWMQGMGALLGPGYLGLIGALSPPTQIVPILLIGLGVDFAIHMNARYREEVGTGATPATGAVRATGTVGIALVLATLTTAVGFLTNITNPLPALRDFGVLAAIGIVAAFVLMLTFVPSVRLLLDRRADAAERLPRDAMGDSSDRALPRVMARTSVLARHFAVPTLVVTLLLGGLGAYGLTRLSTEFSFTDFVPQDSPLLPTLDTIQAEFGGGFGETTQVLLEGDIARPEAHNALVASLGRVADTRDVLTFGGQPAANSIVSSLGQLVSPPPEAGVEPDPALVQTLFGLGLQQDLTVAPDADVAALYRTALEAAPDQVGTVVSPDDGGFVGRVEIRTQAGEDGARALAANLDSDFEPLVAAGVDPTPTSNNIVSAVIIKALQDSQIVSLIITLAAAMLLLVVTFAVQARRPMLGVLTTLPVALVVLWTFGLMAATGIPFGPVTAVLSALAIGIGVPFTIHITHRFQEDRARYPDANAAIDSTVRHTGGALAGSALTTIAGFGILTTSSLTPFRQMGQVTAYAIGLSLVAAVLVLPSMLVLWDRWHRRHGTEPHETHEPVDVTSG